MRFFYARLRTCAQYASMNEFTCSEQTEYVDFCSKLLSFFIEFERVKLRLCVYNDALWYVCKWSM